MVFQCARGESIPLRGYRDMIRTNLCWITPKYRNLPFFKVLAFFQFWRKIKNNPSLHTSNIGSFNRQEENAFRSGVSDIWPVQTYTHKCRQTDGSRDGRTDGRTDTTEYYSPPLRATPRRGTNQTISFEFSFEIESKIKNSKLDNYDFPDITENFKKEFNWTF